MDGFNGVQNAQNEALCNLTPPVSHGGQNYNDGLGSTSNPKFNKYTINLDMLTFCAKGLIFKDSKEVGEEVFERGNFVFTKHIIKKGKVDVTGNFNYEYTYRIAERYNEVLHDIGLLFTCVREGRVIDKELSKIEIDNKILYERGFSFRLCELLKALDVSFNNFTRIDIAIDGARHLDNYRFYSTSDEYEKVGRAKVTTIQDAKCKVETFYIGNRKSGKMVRGYCKSQEIDEKLLGGKVNKEYIKEFWENNSLDTSNDIDRLEIELHRKPIEELSIHGKPLGLAGLEDTRVLASIARNHIDKFYQFKKVDKKQKNRSRWERLDMVDWEELEQVEMDRKRIIYQKQVIPQAKKAISFEMQEMAALSASATRKKVDKLITKEQDIKERIEQLEAKNERILERFETPKSLVWVSNNQERIVIYKRRLADTARLRQELAEYVVLSDRTIVNRRETYERCRKSAAKYGLTDWFYSRLEYWENDYMREVAIWDALTSVNAKYDPVKYVPFGQTVFA